MKALKLPISNKSVLNGCSLWHPLNYNEKLWLFTHKIGIVTDES
jgi:hypothetical protein